MKVQSPFVSEEWLQWRRGQKGKPFRFWIFEGSGRSDIRGHAGTGRSTHHEELESPEVLAVNTLGQFAKHPRVSALRRFITGGTCLPHSRQYTRGPRGRSQERLSQTGDNLPNVIQYLKEQHPERLTRIFDVLSNESRGWKK